jgi:hypothetical protein
MFAREAVLNKLWHGASRAEFIKAVRASMEVIESTLVEVNR